MRKLNLIVFSIILILIGIGFGFAAALSINSNDVLFDNNGTILSSDNVQDAINELSTRVYEFGYNAGKNDSQPEVITKVATNFYNAGVDTFTVMPLSGASAAVKCLTNRTNTKSDNQHGQSDPIYLYRNPNGEYGVITAINIPLSAKIGGAYGYVLQSSYTAKIQLLTDTGVVLDSVSYSSENLDRTLTWKPANYNISSDVEYIYVYWQASGVASISSGDYPDYGASFYFNLGKITAEYLPLS